MHTFGAEHVLPRLFQVGHANVGVLAPSVPDTNGYLENLHFGLIYFIPEEVVLSNALCPNTLALRSMPIAVLVGANKDNLGLQFLALHSGFRVAISRIAPRI